MKRIFSILLCIVLCLSCLSGAVFAFDMDDNELPIAPIDPDLVVPTRQVRVVADGWQEVYVYTWEPEDFGTFPGVAMEKLGTVYATDLFLTVTNLILSEPGSNRQTAPITLEKSEQAVVITIDAEGNHQVHYGTFGDVTGDGRVNIGDAAKIYSHLRGSNPLTNPATLAFADATGDGRVNMGDVAKIYGQIKTIVPSV